MLSALAAAGGAALAGAQENWQPAFLSSTENEVLLAVGERIIPGSRAAGSNQVIDLLLGIESPATQNGFREALRTFSDAGFEKMPATQQDSMLTRASGANDTRQHAFLYLKEWLADAYWTSREGMKELGFDGRLAWPEFNPGPHTREPAHQP
jgi:hypothetical protein